jgi:hypothetical protein
MAQYSQPILAPLFQAVSNVLRQNRQALNRADLYNGDHGDHMVEVFEIAARAAQEKGDADLAESMQYASQLLGQTAQNGSAQAYARGLALLAEQFRSYQVALDDLLPYVQNVLAEDKEIRGEGKAPQPKSGEVLKALLAGLASWSQVESGQAPSNRPLDMGALFEFGMAYLQAKQRGGSKAEVLADAAASVSPLSRLPHRYQSGKMVIQALLEAMQSLSFKPVNEG